MRVFPRVREKNTEKTRESPVARLQRANAARRAAGLPIGRPKGTPNTLTAVVRGALTHAFHALGGHEAFAAWAREHPSQFYGLLLKGVPKEREANTIGTGVQIFIQDGGGYRPVVNERRVLDDVASEWTDDEVRPVIDVTPERSDGEVQ